MDICVSITREFTRAFPQHQHSVFEIMHYVEGTGTLKTQMGDYAFCPGVVIVMPPGIMHGSVSDEQFRDVCIHMPLSLPELNEPLVIKNTNDLSVLTDLIYRLVMADREKNMSAVNHLIKAAEDLIRFEMKTVDDRFTVAAEHVHQLILENFADEDFNMSAVIAATHYTDDYFRVMYRRRYGITPYAFLLDLRINCAADLLREYEKQFTITEIARQSGFSDPLYFSRLFKKKKGVSPRDFVKGLRHE